MVTGSRSRVWSGPNIQQIPLKQLTTMNPRKFQCALQYGNVVHFLHGFSSLPFTMSYRDRQIPHHHSNIAEPLKFCYTFFRECQLKVPCEESPYHAHLLKMCNQSIIHHDMVRKTSNDGIFVLTLNIRFSAARNLIWCVNYSGLHDSSYGSLSVVWRFL